MTAANQAPELLLHHHLKKLRLPTVLREYEKLARHCATENVDHVRYLARPSMRCPSFRCQYNRRGRCRT